MTTGGLVQSIEDVDTTQLSGAPAGWSTPAGGGLHLITDYTVDFLGRTTQTLGPSHSVDIGGAATTVRTASWTVYLDSLFTVYSSQGYATGTSPSYSYTLVNPVSVTISDAVGKVTDQISAIRASTAGALSASDTFPQSYLSLVNQPIRRWHGSIEHAGLLFDSGQRRRHRRRQL